MAERPRGHQVPTGDEGGAPPDIGSAGPPPPEPSHAERCRTLVAGATRGSLCTLAADPEGYPYGSVASYALDDAGNPLFFVSLMAEHTQNALRDPRASLLATEPVPEGADPLASGRVTLLGLLAAVEEADRAAVRDRYLEANPTSAYYIDFGDFAFYRLTVESIRYVGGYGRMSWVDPAAYAVAEPDPLAGEVAAGIIEHMNADHADAQVLYCRHLAGRPETTEASMSAVDRYGFEMIAVGPSGRAAVRLGFPQSCATGEEVRKAMVAMVAEARAKAAAG
jgi:putative heme iron utilization protein